MPLLVHTARLTYGGPDRFDITWKSSDADGKRFSPSGKLLGFGVAMRDSGKRKREEALRARDTATQRQRISDVEAFEEWSWLAYRTRYEEAMRIFYKNDRARWEKLLARRRVVLVCYCTDCNRCHRRVLADILVKLGAIDGGELPPEEQRRVAHKPVSGRLFSEKEVP